MFKFSSRNIMALAAFHLTLYCRLNEGTPLGHNLHRLCSSHFYHSEDIEANKCCLRLFDRTLTLASPLASVVGTELILLTVH